MARRRRCCWRNSRDALHRHGCIRNRRLHRLGSGPGAGIALARGSHRGHRTSCWSLGKERNTRLQAPCSYLGNLQPPLHRDGRRRHRSGSDDRNSSVSSSSGMAGDGVARRVLPSLRLALLAVVLDIRDQRRPSSRLIACAISQMLL